MKTRSDHKSGLHPRNRHQAPYDFAALCLRTPELQPFVFVNPYGASTIDFADPAAVKALNKALLALHYGIQHWDLPAGYLCPPIPGRVDYLHRVADLLAESAGKVPTGKGVRVLDVGVGANCIYPLLGAREYGWRFVGSDIDPVSVKAASLLANSNGLGSQIECRLQCRAGDIFQGIVAPRERFALTLCNPPFHASLAEASKGTERKLRNLGKEVKDKPVLNFGGQKAELWCEGGEAAFLAAMINQSRAFAEQCLWFSSLVSKKDNLPAAKKALTRVGARQVRVLEMAQGNKVSRVLAWTFFDEAGCREWWSAAR
ncbi:23S rRNA (adenine(1618)-N(6))-methyltransferase RlmF [Aeromonas dhakensis]|uniref:23S rRNA (adenine(1618)-N(6))-methyltransferase RlmF n=1 Tax=Aeromonas TaxID=642 RepID=UPI0005B8D4D5|nr:MULTISPECIES: 23S rRNA (adenine(1618)-N(6))-methyltransferase RlmF [Aeromonas]MDD9306790.1 23S rRNA (adenine(1618)-N(6))-methyltransferase RlmF [Aeromonas hydrophila]ELM3750810.1 23S rRNA (adenine(1618)-N(6))-methyltransferase RlmF [Aeromonas dhakensis]MBL0462255.1 23S rRNA (adenine(1618)-N(6))-methyltransferase RlmF [Aeromonas dhakensis]MBL0600865.1 23S rRNA (adenine(1618)-N(6))-methyltransferase RlmF [Aeromonas dhakensis]MBL0620032.1 23S rRNA (adenine(1618)-N(6))-methyltransferase RlmF [A